MSISSISSFGPRYDKAEALEDKKKEEETKDNSFKLSEKLKDSISIGSEAKSIFAAGDNDPKGMATAAKNSMSSQMGSLYSSGYNAYSNKS